MEQKTKRLWIRLSPEEETLFRQKAAGYKSVSAMIRDAVNKLGDNTSSERIKMENQLVDYFRRYQQQLSWLGGNFNQAIKRANELAIGEELTPQFFERVLYPQLRESTQLIVDLKRALSQAVNSLPNP
jgi:hypothetical protein